MSKDIYKSVNKGNQGYWQDVENKVLDPKKLNKEFEDGEFDSFSIKKNRRSFLKIMGFSVSALPLTGCVKIPVRKAVPYLYKNDVTIVGVPTWYATTFGGYPVLAKTREGRPIKIEGNKKSKITEGAANAQMQAAVISLYDSNRYRGPQIKGQQVEWEKFDEALKSRLQEVTQAGKSLVVIAPPSKSPSETRLLREFAQKLNATVIYYDSAQNHGLLEAAKESFGEAVFPEYNLEKADYILSFGADFLSTYGDDLGQTRGYIARRDPQHPDGMSKHVQVESLMSMTGMNADYRFTRTLQEQRAFLMTIYSALMGESAEGITISVDDKKLAQSIASDLKTAGSRAVILSDDKDKDAQVLVNKINAQLGALGNTVSFVKKNAVTYSNSQQLEEALNQMSRGEVGGVFFYNTNPVYNYSVDDRLTRALKAVPLTLSTAMAPDETSSLCEFVAPTNHIFESWGDLQVSSQEFATTQPLIQPLFGSRMAPETLMRLAQMEGSYDEYVKSYWQTSLSGASNGTNFWNKALHDGVVQIDGQASALSASPGSASASLTGLKYKKYPKFSVQTYMKSAIRDGEMANNPFLHELPDPVTKATWDNYVMISPKFAAENGIKSGDMVELKAGGHAAKAPAIVQPGTANNTFGIALGYGRSVAGKVGKGLGANAYKFVNDQEATLSKTGEFKGLAQTQTHHSMEGRDIVRDGLYSDYLENKSVANHKKAKLVHIYPEHAKEGHQWAMSIDLNKCTGCSACIVSCNTENNVPVVGRQEVANRREMHWIRLDRYYKGDENEPEVLNMPMLCQHCENAPCENVCPVLATVHSSDGINQQIYNRCVGTRYCANNCPYKVRRFNWFNYDRGDSIDKLALNPDISQRSRGVMEKCSFCIQRIQSGKLEAKRERRALKDGDIQVACQQSCPGDAIVFGDMKDPESKISKYLNSERNYTVLRELNVQPRVSYLTKIKNK